jgi:pyruvate dehydrogenase E2 component (dihydrolipoamide acetyltransferase)
MPTIEDVDFTDYPQSAERKSLATKLTQTKQAVPHYYLTVEISVDKAIKLRDEVNQRAKGTYQISLDDFVIKAAALALRKVPEVNATWNETSIRR